MLTATKIVLTDAHDRTRIVLDAAAGTPSIEMYEADHSRSLSIGSEVGGVPRRAAIQIFEADGTPGVTLGMLGSGPKFRGPYPALRLNGRYGSTAEMSLGPGYGEPLLIMRDTTGTRLDLGMWFLDRRPYLKLYDVHASPRAALYLDGRGDAVLRLRKKGERQVDW